MANTADEAQELISLIKTRGEAAEDAASAIHLIRWIPYAGGTIAAIISERASQRRIEKVCDVLSNLNARLERHGTEPEQHLSKDQIIEVIHETLQTVSTASDEKKIEALKSGLGYAFLSGETFESKQLMLKILRDCTSIELLVLPVLYDTSDPYQVREGSASSPSTDWNDIVIPVVKKLQTHVPKADWKAVANREDCSKEPLLTFLSAKIGIEEGATEAALRLLDGKGLASAGPNLMRSDCQVLQWRDSTDPNGIGLISYSATSTTIPTLTVRPTPLEASRTKFGKQFLNFCLGYLS